MKFVKHYEKLIERGFFMPLTPLEIHNKEFKKSMRGYDIDEVNEFLDQVIRDYELYIRQNKEKEDELELVKKKLSNYEEMQDSLNRSILVAQEAADRLKENTDREIEVMKREAHNYAENVRKEADYYAAEVKKKADEYAEETRKKADQYATEVHKEADDNADALLQESVAKARKIEDETEALRKQSRVFRQRLQLLIESQLELLTKEDWDNLLVGRPIEYPNTETISKVEKELEEKVEEATDESLTESETHVEEGENEVVSDADTVAIDEDDHYNNESYESDEYEEGTIPAVELADSVDNN